MMYLHMDENPFKVEERKYPVDFIYATELTYLFKLTLPDGYKVSEMPKPLIIKMPDNSASCLYQITNIGNILQLTYRYMINKPIFTEDEYGYLRAFFAEVIKKQAEPIVLSTNL